MENLVIPPYGTSTPLPHIESRQQYNKSNSKRIESSSPFAVNQANWLNRNTPASISNRRSNERNDVSAMFARAVSNFPVAKASALLHALLELETTLRLEGVASYDEYGERIDNNVGIGVSVSNTNAANDDTISILSLKSQPASSINPDSIASATTLTSSSVLSRYSSNKSYGQCSSTSNEKQVVELLKSVGRAMTSAEFKALNYDITGRNGRLDILGPTLLRARLSSDLKLELTTKEITSLMLKFDTDSKGAVDINAVLGSAKLMYDQQLNREAAVLIQAKKELQKKQIARQRALHKEKTESAQAIYDATQIILEKMKVFSFEAIRTRKMKHLHACRNRLSPQEYQTLLVDLGVVLSSRQVRILQKRYWIGQVDMIDVSLFKAEFIPLGKELLREIRKAEALKSFIDILSKGDVAVSNSSKDYKNGLYSSNNNRSGKSNVRLSLKKTEEWLADPLSSVSATKGDGNGSYSKSKNMKQSMLLSPPPFHLEQHSTTETPKSAYGAKPMSACRPDSRSEILLEENIGQVEIHTEQQLRTPGRRSQVHSRNDSRRSNRNSNSRGGMLDDQPILETNFEPVTVACTEDDDTVNFLDSSCYT